NKKPPIYMHKSKPFRNLFLPPLISLAIISCSEENESAGPVHPKVDKLNLPAGFKAEHLYSPGENEQGSWVAMAFDDKGRMITADQYGALYRLDIPAIGSDSLRPQIEKLKVGTDESKLGMGYAQGLLYAFNKIGRASCRERVCMWVGVA